MHAFSLALLYGILWINSVHGSEDNNVRRLSKDIPEQDFADPQGENALLSAQDHKSMDSQDSESWFSMSFFRRNKRDIIIALCVSIVVPMSIVAGISAAVSKVNWDASVGAAFAGMILFIIAFALIIRKDRLMKQGLTLSWWDFLKDHFKDDNTRIHSGGIMA